MDGADPITLRSVRPADAASLALLHVEVWEQAYSGLMPASVFEERRAGLPERVERWAGIIATSPAATTVALAGDRVVGFASVGPAREDDLDVTEELWALYVHRDHWDTGVGHRLLVDSLGARPAYLWVLDGNDRAIGFYRRQGFVEDGARRRDELGEEIRMVRR